MAAAARRLPRGAAGARRHGGGGACLPVFALAPCAPFARAHDRPSGGGIFVHARPWLATLRISADRRGSALRPCARVVMSDSRYANPALTFSVGLVFFLCFAIIPDARGAPWAMWPVRFSYTMMLPFRTFGKACSYLFHKAVFCGRFLSFLIIVSISTRVFNHFFDCFLHVLRDSSCLICCKLRWQQRADSIRLVLRKPVSNFISSATEEPLEITSGAASIVCAADSMLPRATSGALAR